MNGDKRKFLFVSITGLISDIAWQVAKEGHEVRYCIEDEKERDIADGFVAAIDLCGNELAKHCPRTEATGDELPDRIYLI
jgi:uncharacterized membrane protein